MRILGIDPGIGRMGWGIIRQEKGVVESIVYDCFETEVGEELPVRLKAIYSHVTKIINKYHPDNLAIEELFFNTNAKTAFIVGQARGVVLLAAAEQNIPVTVYTPLQVKVAVTGYGMAEKKQVERMVMTFLKIKEKPRRDDASDALAIALTHAFSRKLAERSKKAIRAH